MTIELGISTFGETTLLESTGKAISHDQRIRDLVEEIELADQVGLDIYAIGEHHREDFAVSVSLLNYFFLCKLANLNNILFVLCKPCGYFSRPPP